MDELWVCNVGTIDYPSALALQERLRAARQAGVIPDVLLLLEHDPPVYTRGRRSAPGELSMGAEWYASKGISIIETKRGGKVTYHGPGQLVGYGIIEVTDVVGYVRLLEHALVEALAQEGVTAHDRADEGPDYTGVWVENRKIASIGVHLSHGVTAHGFAVNVDNDLAPFGWVVACGLPDVAMTSLVAETGGVAREFGAETGEALGSVPAAEIGGGAGLGGAGRRNAGLGGAGLGNAGVGGAGLGGGCGNLSPRMVCFRKRVGFAVASALGRRQRLVSLDRLERYATTVPELATAQSVR